MAGIETVGGTMDPMLLEDACNVLDGRENADVPSSEDETGVVGELGVEEAVRARARWERDVDGEATVDVLPSDGGRGDETEDDAPRPIVLSRGGGGSIPEMGAVECGMGSTVDWRCR